MFCFSLFRFGDFYFSIFKSTGSLSPRLRTLLLNPSREVFKFQLLCFVGSKIPIWFLFLASLYLLRLSGLLLRLCFSLCLKFVCGSHCSISMRTALKSLSGCFNISVILVLASVNRLFHSVGDFPSSWDDVGFAVETWTFFILGSETLDLISTICFT